jgi:hypothetical protein
MKLTACPDRDCDIFATTPVLQKDVEKILSDIRDSTDRQKLILDGTMDRILVPQIFETPEFVIQMASVTEVQGIHSFLKHGDLAKLHKLCPNIKSLFLGGAMASPGMDSSDTNDLCSIDVFANLETLVIESFVGGAFEPEVWFSFNEVAKSIAKISGLKSLTICVCERSRDRKWHSDLSVMTGLTSLCIDGPHRNPSAETSYRIVQSICPMINLHSLKLISPCNQNEINMIVNAMPKLKKLFIISINKRPNGAFVALSPGHAKNVVFEVFYKYSDLVLMELWPALKSIEFGDVKMKNEMKNR